MVVNESVGTVLSKQLVNPDCSYLTGMLIGQLMTVRLIIFILVVYLLLRIVDKLALTPLLEWIKNKVFKRKAGGV